MLGSEATHMIKYEEYPLLMFTKFLMSIYITLLQKIVWIIFKEIEHIFLSGKKNLISVQISVESRDIYNLLH